MQLSPNTWRTLLLAPKMRLELGYSSTAPNSLEIIPLEALKGLWGLLIYVTRNGLATLGHMPGNTKEVDL